MEYLEALETYTQATRQVRRALQAANVAQREYEGKVAEARRMFPGVGAEHLRREHYWPAEQVQRRTTRALAQAQDQEQQAYRIACRSYENEKAGSREKTAITA